MPSVARFILKNSHPAIRELVDEQDLQGRRYNEDFAEESGGIKASELLFGMKLACLAITDDKPFTLQKIGKTNPWQVEAIKLIAGDQSHAPLTDILYSQFGLFTDHILDVSGMNNAGHILDTQGYIAHNDEIIVLAYRCTTSPADWLTNLTTTSSAWEINEDVAQGHSGALSFLEGYACCNGSTEVKPRVHTGFYNNFLATVPMIREFIEPLLAQDQPRRTLYVVGHSLGGGIATMATCYFLLGGHDWANSKHKLRVVTAGSPRAVCVYMQKTIHARLGEPNNKGQVIVARIVRDKDVVPTVPPEVFGFRHINKLVYITKEEDFLGGKSSILINPNLDHIVSKRKMKSLMLRYPNLLAYQEDQEYPQALDTISIISRNPTAFESVSDDGIVEEADDIVMREEAATLATTCEDAFCMLLELDKRIAESASDISQDDRVVAVEQTDYQRNVKMVPRAFRDHMPDFYLKPLMALVQEYSHAKADEDAATQGSSEIEEEMEKLDEVMLVMPKKKGLRGLFRRRKKKERRVFSSR